MANILFYGDDFTGASDNAAQYFRYGLKSVLFFSDPGDAVLADAAQKFDVVGVAGTSRSLSTDLMTDEVLPILKRFQKLGAPIIQYKCCSTFDSTDKIGSLGHAIHLMRSCWPDSFIPVLAAAPEFGRFTLFGHHFARMGQQVYRLDRHPVMSRHPVTPMSESDLSRILSTQGFDVDELIDLPLLDQFAGIEAELVTRLQGSQSAVFDSYSVDQITTASATIWNMSQSRQICAMASQGLAYGIGRHLRLSGLIDAPEPSHRLPAVDRLLVLSGSCSPLSAAQIKWAERAGFIGIRLAIDSILQNSVQWVESLIQQIINGLQQGKSLVVYTATGPDDPSIKHTQSNVLSDQVSPAFLAEKIGSLFGQIAQSAIKQANLKRLVVSGGDSSSFTMRALQATALEIKASLFVQNAHVCSLQSTDAIINGTEVLLKGGQVGAENLYEVMRAGF